MVQLGVVNKDALPHRRPRAFRASWLTYKPTRMLAFYFFTGYQQERKKERESLTNIAFYGRISCLRCSFRFFFFPFYCLFSSFRTLVLLYYWMTEFPYASGSWLIRPTWSAKVGIATTSSFFAALLMKKNSNICHPCLPKNMPRKIVCRMFPFWYLQRTVPIVLLMSCRTGGV